MPISIAALTANRRTIKVTFGDDVLSVIYKPSAINAKQEARENEERADGKHILSAARSLAEIIHAWDLVDDAGKPVPPSEDVLSSLGLDVLQTITREIITDALPNRTTASSSNGTSPQTGSSAPSRTGT